jgi:hypothetical protein
MSLAHVMKIAAAKNYKLVLPAVNSSNYCVASSIIGRSFNIEKNKRYYFKEQFCNKILC